MSDTRDIDEIADEICARTYTKTGDAAAAHLLAPAYKLRGYEIIRLQKLLAELNAAPPSASGSR